ncbi:MAG: HAD family hydrolase [Polyangiaceae bacterium]|jgi:Ca2+-transporting ATPase|nr:HAD family hydrolase [Polyangiaceae bacterium]
MHDAPFWQAARDTLILSQVAPERKLPLAKAMQDEEQIVAMAGERVNDAPALKQANWPRPRPWS